MPVRSLSIAMVNTVLFLAGFLLLAGCAATGGSPAAYLLEQDYQLMSNADLTAYEQELGEEIARGSGGGWGGTSLGFGIGSWGSNTGFGLGVNQDLGGGGGGYGSVELRDRREAVRVEMRRRGLLPPAGETR
jgi:hypothetical protein